MDFSESLGSRIRERRESRRLSQQDIANALQISPQAVSKWERAENAPDIAVLAPLAAVLGVSTDWLLDSAGQGKDMFETTVLATSIAGAYQQSLTMDARDFASWANGYFVQITEAVLRHDGVPIKYMGDQFLCFFSGIDHTARALRAVRLAKGMVGDALEGGLSCGEVYLGTVGHPDYARPDIMGEVVNIAFLTLAWAETHAQSGIAATAAVATADEEAGAVGHETEVNFKGIPSPVRLCELLVKGTTGCVPIKE